MGVVRILLIFWLGTILMIAERETGGRKAGIEILGSVINTMVFLLGIFKLLDEGFSSPNLMSLSEIEGCSARSIQSTQPRITTGIAH